MKEILKTITIPNETLGVCLNKAYLDAIDILLEKGIYASKGEIVREGSRYIFEKNGLVLTVLKNKLVF